MNVYSLKTLRDFWERHPDAEKSLKAWHSHATSTNWNSMMDIKRRYASASILSADRVVFNIGGNKYRLIVSIEFPQKVVFIKFIGTHRDYDRVDARKI